MLNYRWIIIFLVFVYCKKITKLDFNERSIVVVKNRQLPLMIAVTVIVLCHDLIFIRLRKGILCVYISCLLL